MISQIPELIEDISKYMTLREGDLIMTGTPSGGGPTKPGDFLEASLSSENKILSSLFMKVDKAYP